MIDFNNAESIASAAKEFVSSHDLLTLDFNGYRKCHIGDEDDIENFPVLKELISKDKYGEYLGSFYNQLKNENSLDKEHSVYAYFDDDSRVMAIAQNPSAPSYALEFFEYFENYYVGLMFVAIGWASLGLSNDKPDFLIGRVTYYVCDGGKVTRMITAHDLSLIKKFRIDTTELSYKDGETVINSSTARIYKTLKKGFVLDKECDKLNPPADSSSSSKRRIDNQKKLCKKLEKKIDQDMSLDEAMQAFLDVVAEAKPNDEAMLSYEVGCYSFDGPENCYFCLVRQTPSPDDEFYQMHLELQYDICDEVRSLNEGEWCEKGDDLQEYVKNSEAYNALKDKPIKKISVWTDET